MRLAHHRLIIHPRHDALATVPQRFPKTFHAVGYKATHLPHPEQPAYPHGSSAETIIYSLGRSNDRLESVHSLTPEMMRQLRLAAHQARKSDTPIQIFGCIDSHSPYGTRAALEAAIRYLLPLQKPIQLHVGVWHPTPSEYRLGLRELSALAPRGVRMASLFPITSVLEQRSAQKYLDGIIGPPRKAANLPVLPLTVPHIVESSPLSPESTVVLTNHQLHGWHGLMDALADADISLISLHKTWAPHPQWHDALNHAKHIIGIANRPSYLEAYFGSGLHHPYFETISGYRPSELLEMAISPHFSFGARPHHTVMILDEERHPDFDWLVANYLKRHADLPCVCYILDPTSLAGSYALAHDAATVTALHEGIYA